MPAVVRLTRPEFAIFLLILGVVAMLPGTANAQTGTLFVENDRVGIGTDTPQAPLHVSDAPSTTVVRLERAGPSRIEFRDTAGGVSWDFRTTSGDAFVITKIGNGVNELLVNSIGDIKIPGRLLANGGADIFPDYVFEADYKLRSIDDLESFIATEKHLPGVMSRQEVKEAGHIDVSKLQLQLLEKVEELALYVIEQQKEIDRLRAELDQGAAAAAVVEEEG